jgi:hypothetical protein
MAKIKHQIIEVKEYVFPIFFSILTLFFLFGISLFVIQEDNIIFTLTAIPIIWIGWGWIIIKYDLWRPKKYKYVEHIIIEGGKKKNGKHRRA